MPEFIFEGKNIYYETYNPERGNHILLLNGVMMSTSGWAPLTKELSRNNTLILLDFLDQGRSARMDTEYGMDTQAEVIRALIDELKLDKINIAGISYGAEVALNFAAKYNSLLSRMVLFNALAESSQQRIVTLAGWNALKNDPAAYYEATIPAFYSSGFCSKAEDWMEARREPLYKIFGQPSFVNAMERLYNSMRGHYLSDAELSKITVPVLLAVSENDRISPAPLQRTLYGRIPGAEMVTLLDCGHCTMIEKPLLFVALITGFLNAAQTEYTY